MDKNVNNIELTIRDLGTQLIREYQDNHFVESGKNGPYDDAETQVRNLSHLLVIIAVEIIKYGKKELLPTLKEIADCTISKQEKSGAYIMRGGKEPSNGVIGHAWLMEGLIYAYRASGNNDYLDEALRIANMHDFNTDLGLWGRPLEGCSDDAIDVTLNHQLWYAATLYELNKIVAKDEFKYQCHRFMSKLRFNFSISRNGRIKHEIKNRSGLIPSIKQEVKHCLNVVKELCGMPSYAYKEEGYHLFNLMALARIYECDPNNSFFRSKLFKRSLKYLNSKAFMLGLESSEIRKDASLNNPNILKEESMINIYGYPYNVPGFEMCYVSCIFNKIMPFSNIGKCLDRQMSATYDYQKNRFGLNVHDKVVINYRVYEYYRYLEIMG